MLSPSHPKLNLALNILGKDEISNYHFIETVLCEFKDLFDEIDIKSLETKTIEIRSDNQEMPIDERNTMYKAVQFLQKEFNISQGAKINIKKNIPMESGLGGGSSNAAQVLKALNNIWHLNLDNNHLRELGSKIGMDVPFFIEGGTARGTNFGEKIEQLPDIKGLKFQIFPQEIKISTHETYKQVKNYAIKENLQKTKHLIQAIKEGKTEEITKNINNDFEEIIFKKYPEFLNIKKTLESKGHKIHLTGTGSCLFGLRH